MTYSFLKMIVAVSCHISPFSVISTIWHFGCKGLSIPSILENNIVLRASILVTDQVKEVHTLHCWPCNKYRLFANPTRKMGLEWEKVQILDIFPFMRILVIKDNGSQLMNGANSPGITWCQGFTTTRHLLDLPSKWEFNNLRSINDSLASWHPPHQNLNKMSWFRV